MSIAKFRFERYLKNSRNQKSNTYRKIETCLVKQEKEINYQLTMIQNHQKKLSHQLERIERQLLDQQKEIEYLKHDLNEAQRFNLATDESIYNALNVLKDYTIMELRKLDKKNKNLHAILGLESYRDES